MLTNRIFKVVLLLLAVLYIVFNSLKDEQSAEGIGAAALVLLTFTYSRYTVIKKQRFFFLFLMSFMIAQLLSFLFWMIEPNTKPVIDYGYFTVNSLYILSYGFFIVGVLQSMRIKEVSTKLLLPIIILIVLDVFCVYIISSTTKTELGAYEYILEFVYNAVIMVLLSVALINYMYKNNNKSMLLLIGAIFIVFSEIIQLAYFYISDANHLNIVYSVFLVLGFVFFYLQSQLKPTISIENYYRDRLKV